MRSYHMKLLEYFKNLSVYRNTAVIEICHHYDRVNLPEEFVEFLKSAEAVKYLSPVHRSFMFNVNLVFF